MASAVKWVSWVRFPLREFPELLLVFLVEEAGEVLLDAGFFLVDDVFLFVFAGKVLPPISRTFHFPNRTSYRGKPVNRLFLVICSMIPIITTRAPTIKV